MIEAIRKEPNAGVVGELKRLLTLAEAGELTGYVCIAELRATTERGRKYDTSTCGLQDGPAALGYLELAKDLLLTSMRR